MRFLDFIAAHPDDFHNYTTSRDILDPCAVYIVTEQSPRKIIKTLAQHFCNTSYWID